MASSHEHLPLLTWDAQHLYGTGQENLEFAPSFRVLWVGQFVGIFDRVSLSLPAGQTSAVSDCQLTSLPPRDSLSSLLCVIFLNS